MQTIGILEAPTSTTLLDAESILSIARANHTLLKPHVLPEKKAKVGAAVIEALNLTCLICVRPK